MSFERVKTHLSECDIPYTVGATVRSTLLEGAAKLVIEPASVEQVAEVLPCLADNNLPYQALGSGSNTLLTGTPDAPLETILISTKKLRGSNLSNDGRLEVGAGTPIALASRHAARNSFTGLEFARDIPGTTAGAVATDAWHPIHTYRDRFSNANLNLADFNKTISSILLGACLVSPMGEIVTMTADELAMRDRSSRLLSPDNDLLLVDATFRLELSSYDTIWGAMKVICDGRRAMRAKNEALNRYSVGRTLGFSFVQNHPAYGGKSAAQLIAETELLPETLSVAGMHHSKRTANIIGNTGDGTAEGYLRVVDKIQQAVSKEHGVELPLEVKIVK